MIPHKESYTDFGFSYHYFGFPPSYPRISPIGSTPGYVPSYGVPRSGLKEIAPDLVATCAEIPNFAANKTEMSHGVIE